MVSEKIKVSQNFSQISRFLQSQNFSDLELLAVSNFFQSHLGLV